MCNKKQRSHFSQMAHFLVNLQCCIDLKQNKLQIGTSGSETPFLSESDLPPCARLNRQDGPESEDRQLAEALARSADGTGNRKTLTP